MTRATRPARRFTATIGRVAGLSAAAACFIGITQLLAQGTRTPPLVLVGNRDYPPLSYIEDGMPRGVDVDVARAIGRAMGREVRIELLDWRAAHERVTQGSADGLINLGVSDARREAWEFTRPTMTHEFQLFVRASEVAIHSVADLSRRKVGVAPGGFPAEFLETQPGIALVPIQSYDEGFNGLQSGRLDAVAADVWVGAYIIQRRGLTGIAVAGDPFAAVPAGIAVRKGRTDLVESIDRAIRTLEADGTLAAIQTRWRPQEVLFIRRASYQRYRAVIAGAFALVILSALGGWVVLLKRQMRATQRIETDLLESRERLSMALTSAGMGTWRWTAATDTGVRDASLAAMLGQAAVESATTLVEWFEHVHPDDRDRARREFEEALTTRRPLSSEFRITREDGTIRWLRVQGKPHANDAGELTYVTGVAIDITDRKQAEEALRASEEKFAKAFAASPDCIAITDFESGIVDISPRFEALTGYSRGDIIGRTLADLGLITQETRDGFVANLRETGTLRDYEVNLRRKDGEIITVVVSADTLAIGGRLHFLSVSHDVTDQRRLEENLRHASEINRLFVSELEPEPLYQAITQSLRGVLPIDYAAVMLRDPESGELHLKAHTFYGSTGVAASNHLSAAGSGRTPASVALERGDVSVFTYADLKGFGPAAAPLLAEDLRTLCCVPLRGRQRNIGVLSVGSRTNDACTVEHGPLLRELSNYIAIAIENALNHEQVLALKNQLAEEKLYLEEEIRGDHDFRDIIGSSVALRRVLRQIRTVAPTPSTVLLLGETGTGKELLARSLHDLSPRRDRTLVKVNAAALPATLLESELFGYERGAFTGAVGSKVGRFELANHGTLFLDEIGDVPLEMQPKLLRVLQEREFERLGGTRAVHVDVRLIAATNRNLEAMVAEGTFRSDLYYRLNVFPVMVPALRERREDIPALVRHFVQRFSGKMKRQIDTIPGATMDALQRWHWPGNIRELENVIERAVILSPGPVLHVSLPEITSSSLPSSPPPPPIAAVTPEPDLPARLDGATAFVDGERELILRALRDANGVIAGASGAAARLGLKRTTLHSKMRKLGIRRSPF